MNRKLALSSTGRALLGALSCLAASADAQTNPPPRYEISLVSSALTRVSLDSIADMDGDSVRELIVGLPQLSAIRVYSGRTGALINQVVNAPQATFGYAVASYQDVDQDGRENILVGAPRAQTRGAVFHVATPAGAPWTVVQTLTPGPVSPSTPISEFGTSIARTQDYNADGIEEVLVGGPGHWVSPSTSFRAGRVWLVNPMTGGSLAVVDGGQSAELGTSVISLASIGSCAGSNDLLRDFVAGAPSTGVPASSSANTYLAGSGMPATPCPGGAFKPALFKFWTGWSLAPLADVDGDGFEDFLVGLPDPLQSSPTSKGAVAVLSGVMAANPNSSLSDMLLDDFYDPAFDLSYRTFGWSVSSVGDLDGDAIRDVLIGAPVTNAYDPAIPPNPTGQVFAHAGTPGAYVLLHELTPSGATRSFGYACTWIDAAMFAVADPEGAKVYVY